MLEKDVHALVTQWLRLVHPGIMFRTDYAAGMKLTIGQAVRHAKLQSSRAYPDLFIAEPVNGWHGMFIELKRDESSVLDKKGNVRQLRHIKEQALILSHLHDKGYHAVFGYGFEDTIKKIDNYLNGKL